MHRQLWIWPILAAVILAFVGVWVRGRMEAAIKTQISGQSENHSGRQHGSASGLGHQHEIAGGVFRRRRSPARINGRVRLKVSQQGEATQAALLSAPQNAELRTHFKPIAEGRGFYGYVILDINFLVIASGREQIIGMKSLPGHETELSLVCRVTRW